MDYRKLDVWDKSILLIKSLYPLIDRLPTQERFAMANQMRRAVTSISLNIAEGCNRNSAKELKYFLSIARGSAAEVEAQIIICIELAYFTEKDAHQTLVLCDNVKAMLYRFIQKLEK